MSYRPPQITDDHLRRSAAVYIRQSSSAQVRDNVGSALIQRDLVHVPRAWNWPESAIELRDDLGSSADEPGSRAEFERLLRDMAGRVGAVFVSEFSRIGRNELDQAMFSQTARLYNVLLVVGSTVYDFRDPNSAYPASVLGFGAVREHRVRIGQGREARRRKAEHGLEPTPPPVGFVKTRSGPYAKTNDDRVREVMGGDVVRLLGPSSSFEAEAEAIAVDIEEHHSRTLGEVVVLARTRKLLDGALAAFKHRGTSAAIAQRKDEFQSTPFVWLYSLLRLANDRQSRSLLDAVAGTFTQLTTIEVDVEDVVARADASNRDYLREWIRRARSEAARPEHVAILDAALKRLVEAGDFRSLCAISLSWFDGMESRQGGANPEQEAFAAYNEERTVWEHLTKEIDGLLGEEVSLEAFLQELQMHSKEAPVGPQSVTLMTIHGAKGKEFSHVYLIGMVEDEIPSFQSRRQGDQSAELEEERRNCFVAITRAMSTITLSYATHYRGWPKQPSRFLFEMGLLARPSARG